MNEAETRAEHIDPALAAGGWGVVEGSRIRREYKIAPGRIRGEAVLGKPVIADYVLVYRNTKLAVVEAKAWNEALTEGVGQAKDYAEKLCVRFTYATNGQGIYAIDMRTGEEGEVSGFPGPEELWQRTFAVSNAWRDRFAEVDYEDKGGSHPARYYQDIAVQRVLESVAAGNRRILLTLATGTGKTFIAFQIVWKLYQSRWNLSGEPTRRPRVLFLADRNTLASQALLDFSAFADDALVRIKPDDIRKKGKVPKNGAVFFTIFQTFQCGTDAAGNPSPSYGEYPPDFFDFIIIDECHRGGAQDESTWRGILEYFEPAAQLGLTATPKRDENADTYRYFGDPVYIYSLKEGINDGFLTPFKVKQISTTLDDYIYTPDDEVISGEVEAGKRYTEAEFNRIIEIKEREAYRVKLFMEMINQREKTIVFCASQLHALAVRDLINQYKQSTSPNYCQRVTADEGALGDQYLQDFRDNEKTIPTILTTSQKLSTGVDARNVRNIVLMRPINQIIEFKQIIGRGTRLHENKYFFTIYDFVKAYLHFSDPEWDGEPLEPEPKKPGEEDPGGEKPPPPPPPPPPGGKVKVKLADGKEREIQSMVSTSFWHPDGTPLSAAQFMEELYGKLPDFFKNEEELRILWSSPDTRKKLLDGLSGYGFGPQQLADMQRIIHAENCDIFDVLSYVAYNAPPLSRAHRAEMARLFLNADFNAKQQAFLEFVLEHYVRQGVEELDSEKLPELIRLRYHDSIQDGLKDLGAQPKQVKEMFEGFQKYLYQPGDVA
ncbi:MAG: DEAD/DEAH box helicase family protein [Verrucomicrobia bacterium]|nr:DEAD/DEAH box helicase family protein [Verrucomicrobiota bacterium]MCH8510853.1 DEAD/DEAH box helicase family protein [Kiritimatiellia bacterium]